MKLKKPLLALFAATALLAGCTPPPAQVKQDTQQYYGEDMQNSLTGYFNSHGMKAADVKEGLTIPWVASAATLQKLSDGHLVSAGNRSGYMVATGKTSDDGCPVFNIVLLKENGRYTDRYDTQLPVCPKPATTAPAP